MVKSICKITENVLDDVVAILILNESFGVMVQFV